MNSLVSIIVPNFNHSIFLKNRLESIFNQTYKNFEVILLDDCSTDDSWEIISKYINHPKVSYCIKNDINSGSPFKQWDKGISLSKGQWIWIAESDDFADEKFLMTLIDQIDDKTSLVYCASMNIDRNNNESGVNNFSSFLNKDRWNSNYVNDGLDEISNYLFYGNTIVNASGVIFKNLYNFPKTIIEMRFCGDWFFWIYILSQGNVKYISLPLNYFRSHDQVSRNRKDPKSELKRFQEWKITLDYTKSFLVKRINIFSDSRKFDWMIDEMLKQKIKNGRFSWYLNTPPLPSFLKPYFYLRLFKLYLTGNIS
jgi:glycosyltransferase involved in cell wall biosynthesis